MTVGKPLITPVAGSMASPAGRLGVIDQVTCPVRPVRAGVVVAGIAVPMVPTTGASDAITPCTVTVRVVVADPDPVVAVTV